MKVFVIPTWHPTPTRPLWCNWILPHIDLLRESGVETYVLQVGLDGEPLPTGTDPWYQPIRFLDEAQLYAPVPQLTGQLQRTHFVYAAWLSRYVEKMKALYQRAVSAWGRPDLLHAHVSLPGGYAAAKLGKEFGIPVIVQEHYSGFESDARFPWRLRRLIREMGQNAQGFYAVSPGFAERIKRMGLLNVSGSLPNPIDTILFSSLDRHKTSSSFNIITTGALSALKGTDLLFEALKQLLDKIDWRLTVYGDASQRSDYARWLDEPRFAERVSLPGPVTQNELVSAYSNADLYVVSSRSETANVSMLQAMSCGVPVVTTSCGAPETLIDNTVGVAVLSEDPIALANGIMQVARAPQRYDRQHLRQFVVSRYSKQAVAQQVMTAYDKVTAGKANA